MIELEDKAIFLHQMDKGAYVTLLFYQKMYGRFTEDQAKSLCKFSETLLTSMFSKDENDLYYCAKLESNLQKAKELSEKNSIKAKKSWESRKGKKNTKVKREVALTEKQQFVVDMLSWLESEHEYVASAKCKTAISGIHTKLEKVIGKKGDIHGAFKFMIDNLDDWTKKHVFQMKYLNDNFNRIITKTKLAFAENEKTKARESITQTLFDNLI